GGPTVREIARPGLVYPILRIGAPVRIGHRIEVIEVTEVFVEAMHAGKEFVQVTQMILPELASFIAERLQGSGQGGSLRWYPHVSSGLPHRGHSGTDRQLAGDEVRATCRTAGLSVIIGETHTFRC